MAFKIIKEIKIVGTENYPLAGGDTILIEIKGNKVIDYTLPAGRTGNITIKLEGTLDDQ